MLHRQDTAFPEATVSRRGRPLLLWLAALLLVLSVSWELIPAGMLFARALGDVALTAYFWNTYGLLILAWVLLRAALCLIMAVGLLRRAGWAWLGSLLTVHGVFLPSIIVLIALYLLNLITPPVRMPDLKEMMATWLLQIAVPYAATYLLLLYALTHNSVRAALGVTE